MGKRRRRTRKAVGLAPGTLVYTGDRAGSKVRIRVIDYDRDRFEEREVKQVDECFPFMDRQTVTWINVDGVSEAEVIRKLGEHFQMHPLAMEDIMSVDQRPKAEDYQSHLYLVVRMLSWDGKKDSLIDEQVSLVLGKNFVISFQEETEGDVFDAVRERIRTSKGAVRGQGPDYLAYSLLDAIVDNYFVVLEKMGERIDELEDQVTSASSHNAIRNLHRMKRELIFLRKNVWPFREVVGGLSRGGSALITAETVTYLRDVYDHTIQVVETVETYRDMLTSTMDLYLSMTSNRMNEIMKVLTIIGTIFLPITFIAGVYGMNFDRGAGPLSMPELHSPYGYAAVLGLMLGVSLVLLHYFHRRKWI